VYNSYLICKILSCKVSVVLFYARSLSIEQVLKYYCLRSVMIAFIVWSELLQLRWLSYSEGWYVHWYFKPLKLSWVQLSFHFLQRSLFNNLIDLAYCYNFFPNLSCHIVVLSSIKFNPKLHVFICWLTDDLHNILSVSDSFTRQRNTCSHTHIWLGLV